MGSELQVWTWVFFFLYTGVMLACGVLGMRRVHGSDDFATARRGYGPLFLALALTATTASGGTFLGLPGICYQFGVSDVRAKKLTRYIQPKVPHHYYRKSFKSLQAMGHRGALVFRHELVRPEQKNRRRDFIIAISRTNDRNSVPFLLSLADQSKAAIIDKDGLFDRSQVSEKERLAHTDWSASIYSASVIGDAKALAHFREAAVWGANHGDRNLLEQGVRGMKRIPVEENLDAFKEIFAALRSEDCPLGKFSARDALRSLIEHRFRDAVPILASQLDNPNEFNRRVAHYGLKQLVGKDLGKEQQPWLQWHALGGALRKTTNQRQ